MTDSHRLDDALGEQSPLGALYRLGEAFEATGGRVGAATARLMRQRALVDFAVPWLETS